MSEKKRKRINESLPAAPIELTHSLVKQWIEEAKIEVLQNAKIIVAEMIEKANHQTFQRAQEEINKQSQANQASFISVFGIFASIISFLGIEIQFLTKITDLRELLGFSLILFAMIFSFNIALDYLVKSRLDKETTRSISCFYGFVVISFIVGIIFVVWK